MQKRSVNASITVMNSSRTKALDKRAGINFRNIR